jgi:hypothetical protein
MTEFNCFWDKKLHCFRYLVCHKDTLESGTRTVRDIGTCGTAEDSDIGLWGHLLQIRNR